uniref:Uncharacterized protein n=1 Tax=Myotis myotis TaxID=51298 RepID=A0A7J7YE15_MYOMY|nr:hypothetical protein mMyoMyo1_010996 [Myotis myotis]
MQHSCQALCFSHRPHTTWSPDLSMIAKMGRQRNNLQRKEKADCQEKKLNEIETCNMSEKEFRVMVIEFINQMDEKINNLYKNREELKNGIATIKNMMESFNSRLEEAKDQISSLEDRAEKDSQSE